MAKTLNQDTFCTIDVGLVCCAGYDQTLDHISHRADLVKMKTYLEECKAAGDEFDRTKIIEYYKGYYGV